MRPRTRQQAEALAELRERHLDRPCYIDSFHGVPVAGPTLDEAREMSEALDNEGREEAARLRELGAALDFIRECNGEPRQRPDDDLALGFSVESVEEVLASAASFRFRSSTSEVVARVTVQGGGKLLVHTTASNFAGGNYEPPDSETNAVAISEEQAAELAKKWGRQ